MNLIETAIAVGVVEEATAEIKRLRAEKAELAEALREMTADHQRIEPHHEDMCHICRRAQAALAKVSP